MPGPDHYSLGMRATRILLLTALLAPSLDAQQSVTFNETVVFPTFGVDGQDHATIAVNAYGDVFVAWHSGLANGTHMVEGMLVPYVGGGNWDFDVNSMHYLLGDPGLNLLGTDSCVKPDVVALEDGSFVIAWSRVEDTLSLVAQLEATRVEPRDANGALQTTPILNRAAPGEGVLLDDTLTPGQARMMVDLVTVQDSICVAIYAHESSYVLGSQNNEYREYDLRALQMDWSQLGSGSSFLTGPQDLITASPMDNPWFRPFVGGLVLPDVVVDDSGNLVVAWESFWVNGHGGVVGPDAGAIHVERFEPFASSTPLASIDQVDFATSSADPFRRPNLSSSRLDTEDNVSISFMEDRDTLAIDQVLFYDIDYSHGAAPIVTPRYWLPKTAGVGDYHPVPVHGKNKHFCLASRTAASGSRRLIAGYDEGQTMLNVPTTVNFPWRPAVGYHQGGNGNPGSNVEVVFITYEGGASLNTSLYRVRMMIKML